jgi:RNA polymerase-binding transcription factor DksA
LSPYGLCSGRRVRFPRMEIDSVTDSPPAGRADSSLEAAVVELREPLSSEASIDEVDGVLDEVERALSRLDDGTYGLCSSCGEAIDESRLAGRPTTQTCTSCVTPEDD